MSPFLMTTAGIDALSDGDRATVSDLAARRRAHTTVAQALSLNAAADTDRLAASLLVEFRAAWSADDHDLMTAVMLAAIDLDQADPFAPRLMDEIRGIQQAVAA